jgi:hypothetical protein
MNEDNRLKSGAIYSTLWDAETTKRMRADEGMAIIRGRRFSAHLMIQPEAAGLFLTNKVLLDQGFLSRFLVAAQDSLAGTRFKRGPSEEDRKEIDAFRLKILNLLKREPPLEAGNANVLSPPLLTISEFATEDWWEYSHYVEARIGRDGEFEPIKSFAGKSAEQAARMAGVMTILESPSAEEIPVEIMRRALHLADWYLNEALRVHELSKIDQKLKHAKRLLEWLQARTNGQERFRIILQKGPYPLRNKAALEAAIEELKKSGWVTETTPPRTIIARQ